MGKNGYLQRQRNTVNVYRQAEKETDRKSTRLNSSHRT